MAENPQQVLDFLNNLAYRSKHKCEKISWTSKLIVKKNLASLNLRLGISVSIPKTKQHLYAINDEELRHISLKIALFRAYLN